MTAAPKTWDVAEGLAIVRCFAARVRDAEHRTTTMHPAACEWCPFPDAELGRMVDDFVRWTAWNSRAQAYDRHEVRVFRELRHDEQEARIAAAQGLGDRPWGAPERGATPAPAAPTPEPEPVLPAWMR